MEEKDKNMKKIIKLSLFAIIAMFSIIFITSCNNSDDNKPTEKKNEKNIINPPNWLYGTWKIYDSDSFTISANKICFHGDEDSSPFCIDGKEMMVKADDKTITLTPEIEQVNEENYYGFAEKSTGAAYEFIRKNGKVYVGLYGTRKLSKDLQESIYTEMTKK